MHASAESARHVEYAGGVHRHGRRIGEAGDEGLARPVSVNHVNGDRRFLSPGAAERDVEVPVVIERRVIDLVQAGGDRRANIDISGFARRAIDAHGRVTAVQPARNPERSSKEN
jgi:hypothetical protein